MVYIITSKTQSAFRLVSLGLIALWLSSGSAFAQRIGIVYSEPPANHLYDKFAYTLLFMAMQNRARMAGIPYDLLTEDDLTDVANLSDYDAVATITDQGGSGTAYQVNLDSAIDYLNRTGRTQLRLYFSMDDNDDSESDFTGFLLCQQQQRRTSSEVDCELSRITSV